MKLCLLFIISCFTAIVTASEINDTAKQNLLLLQSSAKLDDQQISISSNLAPRYREIIKKRAKLWADYRLSKQADFKVLANYKLKDVAVVLVGSKLKASYMSVAIHPVCFAKQGKQWKMLPLISDFSFSQLGDSKDIAQQIELANSWIREKTKEQYGVHLGYYKSKFVELYKAERSRLAGLKLSPKQLILHFFKQVESKSVVGVCACIGLDINESHYGNLLSAEVFEKLTRNLNESSSRSAWTVLKDQKKSVYFIKEFDIADGTELVTSERAVAFINPKYRDGYQLTSFKVSSDPKVPMIRLPNLLLANEISYYRGFDRSFLNSKLSKLYKEVPKLIFDQIKPLTGATAEEYHSKRLANSSGKSFSIWLKTNCPVGPHLIAPSRRHWQNIVTDWKSSKNKSRVTELFEVVTSDKGQFAVSISFQLNYNNLNKSKGQMMVLKKSEGRWGCFNTFGDRPVELEQTMKKAEALKAKITKDVTKSLGVLLNIVSIKNVSKPAKLKDSDVKDAMKSYFSALATGQLKSSIPRTFSFEKNKYSLSAIGKDIEVSGYGAKRKVVSMENNGAGVYTCCVEIEQKKFKSHAFYILVHSEGKILVDMQNRLGIDADADWSDLNIAVYKNISQYYGKSNEKFIRDSYAKMRSEIAKDNFAF